MKPSSQRRLLLLILLLSLGLVAVQHAALRGGSGEPPPLGLLEQFEKADIGQQLQLLPRIDRTYAEEQLPDSVRFLLALHLLRPQLTWHAPVLPPAEERLNKVDHIKYIDRDDDRRWHKALGGEPWMFADIPDPVRQAARAAFEQQRLALPEDKREGFKEASPADFTWRLKDPRHPDLARVLRLLNGVRQEELAVRARQWAQEIRRNNTVLTCDVTGGYAPGEAAPVVIDVRNADRVAFRLYKVSKPEDLVWVADRIGTDFVFHDHGLQYADQLKKLAVRRWAEQMRYKEGARDRKLLPRPDFSEQLPVARWESRVADLKPLGIGHDRRHSRYDDDLDYDEEVGYFGDNSDRFRERLDKSYRPGNHEWSSWQCDRLVQVPAEALKEPGAYILAAEANGQVCYFPLLVDPLSMTLRRCRDGVFVLVSDPSGSKPAAGAEVLADGLLKPTVTDANGAAFARVFASGERALIAHHQGRFAIGGFGKVFEGVYVSAVDQLYDRYWYGRRHRLREARHEESLAHVYADRHVVAAYTDRPVYRPGQDVHFKVIIRRLAPDTEVQPGQPTPRAFRAEDFDLRSSLRLLEVGTAVPYTVLDSRGRAVAHGQFSLNEYGTAAGQVRLPSETPTGAYALRLRLGEVERLVPEVFGVQYYRRPSFQLQMQGVPERLPEARDLQLQLSGEYYFGKPVARGRVEVRLVRADQWQPLAQVEGTLDQAGKASLTLAMPRNTPGGEYFVVASLTDDSGRAVTRSQALRVEKDEAIRVRQGLEALPRFVAGDQPLEVPAAGAEVVAEQRGKETEVKRIVFPVKDGKATVRLPAPGWYTLSSGGQRVDLFAYGGVGHPSHTRPLKAEKDKGQPRHGWVDLSDREGDLFHRALYGAELGRPGSLLVLFDRQHAKVGEMLRLLVYAPYRQARLLFTIEGRTVVDYHLVTTAGQQGYHVVEIPIRERYLPNFYLQGRMLSASGALKDEVDYRREKPMEYRDEVDEDPRWCRIDVLDPGRHPGEERLKVDVRPGRDEYRPGDKVEVEVRVSDLQGRPRQAELSLGVVDESVYTFGEDRVAGLARIFSDPHPEQRFASKSWRSSLGQRWVMLRKADFKRAGEALQAAQDSAAKMLEDVKKALQDMVPQPVGIPLADMGGQPPASQIPLGRLRNDFRETAVWQPQLRTAADGSVRTTFTLPDSLTRYRLTAVALTPGTDIGTARASLRVSQPLAVQLILPRFAVEKDRLQAAGVIHNNSSRERICSAEWQVEGGQVGDREELKQQLTIPAGKSARVGLWLRLEQPGTARVALRCQDGVDGDGETRLLPVHTLGREHQVSYEGVVQGQSSVRLPAGFVPRELHVVAARGDLGRALDGLGGLIDYPYGCVEQTMSRFLPAVLARQAVQQGPLTLPPEVEKRLPEVLLRGLARLYNFQHADGGWGWWEKDPTHLGMTLYVVHGLTRCRASGTDIDAEVLKRGCVFLEKQLQDPKTPAEQAARGWLVLALAHHGDCRGFLRFLEANDKASPATCAYLALACAALGWDTQGKAAAARLTDWRPDTTEGLALQLEVQLIYRAPAERCQLTAALLLKRRHGLQWEHTQATAAAIAALTGMVARATGVPEPRRVRVAVGDKTVLDLQTPEQLKPLVYRLHMPADKIPKGDALPIALSSEGGEPMVYTVATAGIQRLDRVTEPSGTEVRLRRRLETVDGQPLAGKIKPGQVIAVRLQLELQNGEQYLLIEDRRPAGCEFADERIAPAVNGQLAHVEFRDDRVCIFANALGAGRHEIVYYLRAETPGVSHLLPGIAYPMYSDRRRGETGTMWLEIGE